MISSALPPGPLGNATVAGANLVLLNSAVVAAVEAVGDRVREQEEFFLVKQAA